MLKLFVSAVAKIDLVRIDEFGVERFGTSVSDAYLDALAEAFEDICANPERGRVHSGYSRSVLRSLSCRRHRIFYDIEADTVRLVRVLHQAMDYDRHLR